MNTKAKALVVIRTTVQLRQRLAESIVALRSGKISVAEANAVSSEADKIQKRLRKQLKEGQAKHKAAWKGKAA